ncbi:tumor necrosis factor receptor superfamily member 13B isoform X2 [Pristis pectinata]|uniref:tumor necrosis factor receptor superfamily member 13B isoform X2 n=1 Tax=Pristis pectinata TaxID=685728 RepID=UPI00223E661D|nr:tumor necrosis factor receptor superfamily member 13B isoform X2 [Pristis pectinata]
MSSCSDDEFWDELLRHCSKCLHCGRNWHVCKSPCEIWKCNNTPGFYWDRLLRKCIKCADVCGQHPQQCSEICNEITSSNQDSPASLKNCLPHEDHFNILIFVFLAASLCIVTCLFLILLVYTVKRRNIFTCDTTASSHKTGPLSEDRLLQRGVERDDQNQSISSDPSSEPSETCSYCFSEQRIGRKERKLPSNLSTSHQCIQIAPAADTRALPSATVPQNKPFQIICSPSQPSTKEIESFLEKCHIKY